MKLIILFSMFISIHAFAQHDFQYSVKHPDGKIETKTVENTESFSFSVGKGKCTVYEPEADHYKVKCIAHPHGTYGKLPLPSGEEDFKAYWDTVLDPDQRFVIEIVIFKHKLKPIRQPFPDGAY